MKISLYFCLLLFLSIIIACEPEDGRQEEIMGLRPVYGTAADLEVNFLHAREICQPGKIYRYGSYLVVNELHKGIHMIDNAKPSEPKNLGFIKITGNVDMAVKEGFLYADHMNSMVIIDVRNPQKPRFVKSVEKAFDFGNNDYPPVNDYFECVDPGKGPVVGWAEALLHNPQCFR